MRKVFFMIEETMDALKDEKNEQKKGLSQNWVIRCSQEQKEFFQKMAAKSGLAHAEFLFKALCEFDDEKLEDEELEKIVCEVDFYAKKIQNIIKSNAILPNLDLIYVHHTGIKKLTFQITFI